jgi:arsenite/tail-anchored protein-transporting ATPase
VAPRTIFHTGAGGAGKTAVAAATARRCAAAGQRTRVVSLGPDHALGRVLGVALDDGPARAAPGLWAEEIDVGQQLRRRWSGIGDGLGGLLAAGGLDRVSAEEIVAPPGVDEILRLLVVKERCEEADVDVLIVDCPSGGEALRLLALPDTARWWLSRFGSDSLRGSALHTLLELARPADAVLGRLHVLLRDLVALNEILADHDHVSVRLVQAPEPGVADASEQVLSALHLFGYATDAVVVNRVVPADAGPYFADRRARQSEEVGAIRKRYDPVPVLQAPDLPYEPSGPQALDRLGDELFAEHDPAAVLHRTRSQELTVTREDAQLRLDLPFVAPEDVRLTMLGTDLLVRVRGHQRTFALPDALSGYRPAGATVRDGALLVRFDRLPSTVPDA